MGSWSRTRRLAAVIVVGGALVAANASTFHVPLLLLAAFVGPALLVYVWAFEAATACTLAVFGMLVVIWRLWALGDHWDHEDNRAFLPLTLAVFFLAVLIGSGVIGAVLDRVLPRRR